MQRSAQLKRLARWARLLLGIAAAGLMATCGGGVDPPTPTAPTTTPADATISQLAISGLPEPLLFDIPSSLQAGQAYPLSALVTLSDGSNPPIKATAVTWSSSDPSVASFAGNVLGANREGAITITLSVVLTTLSRNVTVRVPSAIVREERFERIPISECGMRPCPYPWCPGTGPYWLFPVYTSGAIELIDAQNPGWGAPYNYVTQLSPKGEYIRSWSMSPGRKVAVPGGFMYVFTMLAESCVYGDVSAVWTHPG